MEEIQKSNIERINDRAKDSFKLISWVFHPTHEKNKKTREWEYPGIQTMTGVKDNIRSYDNGYCHISVKNNLKDFGDYKTLGIRYVFLSHYMGDEFSLNDDRQIDKIIFRKCKVLSDDWDKLNYVLFFDKKGNMAVKVDWQKNKSIIKERALKTDKEYVIFDIKEFEVFYNKDIPNDYEPFCYYKKLKRPITNRYSGAHTKKVIGINIERSIDGNELHTDELKSIKYLFECLTATGKWEVSNYENFRNKKSRGSIIKSKDKIYEGRFFTVNGQELFIISKGNLSDTLDIFIEKFKNNKYVRQLKEIKEK